MAIKAQALVDLIVECSFKEEEGLESTSERRDKVEKHQAKES